MHISKLRIQNFRCFEDITIEFNQGLNVIIGENNSGKTTILKALELVLGRSTGSRPRIDDFYRKIFSLENPPKIDIAIVLQGDKEEHLADKAVVATWLTKLDPPWEATLTYRYFLPENNIDEYKNDMNKYKTEIMENRDQGINIYFEVLVHRCVSFKF